jgi:hypothetical protein
MRLLVVLTRKVEKTRVDLLQEFHRPPAEFEGLDRGDLEALERMIAKLTRVPTSAVASCRRWSGQGDAMEFGAGSSLRGRGDAERLR